MKSEPAQTAGNAPEPISQLALEIRNLAHRGWEDRPNAEFLFREIGKRAQKISERAASSQEATPPQDYKALVELAARVLLQHMNDEDYEMSLAGLYAKLTENYPLETAEPAPSPATKEMPPDLTQPNTCPRCGSGKLNFFKPNCLPTSSCDPWHNTRTKSASQGPATKETPPTWVIEAANEYMGSQQISQYSSSHDFEVKWMAARDKLAAIIASHAKRDLTPQCPSCGSKHSARDTGVSFCCNDSFHTDAGAKSVVAAPQNEISQWIDTELWNFAHALALDLGVSHDAAGDRSKEELIHRSMAAVIGICLRMAGAAALPLAQNPTTPFKDYYGDRWVPMIQRAVEFMSDCELTEFTREKTLNCMTAFALEMAVPSPPVPSKEPK